MFYNSIVGARFTEKDLSGNVIYTSPYERDIAAQNGNIIYYYISGDVTQFEQDTGLSRVSIPSDSIFCNKFDSCKSFDDVKNVLLNELTVTVNGNEFYADPYSRADINEAIGIVIDSSQTSTLWKVKNNAVAQTVTLADLKTARVLALQAKALIVGVV